MTIAVTITTNEENDAPVFSGGSSTAAREVAENSPANTNVGDPISATDEDQDTLTYLLEGTQQEQDDFNDAFQLNASTGQITVKANDSLNFEDKASYTFDISVSDNNGGTATINVTINVTNVEEDGTVTFDPAQPGAGTLLTATLTDPDGNISGETWEWSKSATSNGTFTVITSEISNTYTPTVDDVGKFLKAKASYTDDEGSGKNAEAVTTSAVVSGNTPPTFPDGNSDNTPDPLTFDVEENSVAGTVAGTVSTTDSDSDMLTYSLDGDAAEVTAFNAAFVLNPPTGAITVKANDSLDHETTDAYTFDIGVSDGKDAAGMTDATVDATVSVTINITDVNEAPTFDANLDDTLEVAENTPADTDIGTPFTATDPDVEDTLTYTLDSASAPVFDIDDSGQLKTKAALDFETKPSYTVTVSVRDSKDSSGTADTAADNTTTVTINVDNVDEDGTVTLSPTQPQVDTALTATLTDLDGAVSVTAWQWARADTSTGTFADIVGGTAASYTPVADDLTKYLRATATYTDPQGSGKSADAVADNAVDPAPLINTDPAFSADTATRSVAENTEAGENIGLPVTATDDNTGDTLTYTLDGIDAADFAIDAASGQITVGASTTLDHETKPTYTVTVSVRDSEDSNGEPDTIEDDTITVTINVTDVDEDGTVTLSSDTPQIGTALTATLTDPDGTVSGETWQWAKADSATGAFADIANATAESYTPADDDLSKFLKATVSYTDGEDSGKSAYKVSANPVNAAPEFSEENATRSVDENTEAGHAIGTPVTATDATTVTYTLGGTDAASFSIVSGTGQLLTKAELDFEGKSSYDVTVIATDASGATASIPVTITVNNLDEAGTVKLTLLQPQVGTEQTATLDDPDGTLSRVSWQWARGDSATGSFTNVSSGTDPGSYTPVAADVGKFLRATATYDDGHGAGKSANAVSTHAVQLAPATNDTPVFSEATASRSVAENAVPGTAIGTPVTASDANSDTLTYSLGGDDAASFDIVPGTGQLQTKAALDFESDKKSYTVVVTATDPSGALDTIMVTITVTNVDEAGTVTLSTVQSQVGTALTAMLTDLDGDPSNVTWQWGRGDISTGPFSDVSSAPSYTPVAAADVGKFLRATATYTDPQGPGKTAHGVSTHAVQAAPDGPNNAPVFLAASASRSVAEDAITGANIGTPVIATDADGEALTYSLPATDTAPFSIVQESGQLQTTAALNFEDTPSYTVTVTATDPSGESATITVTISVGNVDEPGIVSISPSQFQVGTELTASLTDPDGTISGVTWQWDKADTTDTYTNVGSSASYTPTAADVDKFLRATATYTDAEGSDKSAASVSDSAVEAAPPTNEAPEFPATTATRTVAENTAAGTNFGTAVTATDSVGDTLTYSLGGTDAGSFSIVETSGQLQTKAELDFEGKNSYEVTVIATDVSQASTSIPVTITVNNVEEAGTVTLTLLQPQVGIAQTATLTDPDKNPSRVSWQWARGDSASGPFTNVSSGADPGSYTPIAADLNKYLRATATYDDDHGPGKTASAVSTNAVRAAPATNSAPVFSEATASRSVPENTDAGQDIGTPVTASDAASDTLTYSLGSDDAASFDIVPGTGQLQTKAPLDFETTPSYIVTVTATDPSGAPDTITVTITVTNMDEAGTVTLSNIQPQVGTELTAMLEDTDGDPTSVTWQWGRGDTSDGSFDNISSGASYTPAAPDVGKFLQATATYTDPQGPGKTAHGVSAQAVQAAPDGPNNAPVFSSNTAIRSVAEDAIEGSNVGTPVIATDADNDTLTYSLAETDTAPLSIVQESGQLQTTAELDYETTPSYTVTVTATDPSGLVGSITVTISVGNVDEPGTVSISPSQPQVGTALTATLTDPDGTTSAVTWQWARGDTTGPYANVSSGASYTPVAADVGKFLQATATYTDPQGSGKSAAATTVNAVQAAPIVNVKSAFSSETDTRTIAENTEAEQNIGAPVTATDANNDTLAYSLDAVGAESFGIVTETGQLKTKADLDFETQPRHTVTVSVRDSKNADGNADTVDDDSIEVTITVTNVDEDGSVTLSPGQPQVDTPLTATLTDPDGAVSGETWEWARGASASGTFADIINGATAASYTPVAADVGKFLQATATYTDAEGSGKSADAVSPAVRAAPITNEAPAFPSTETGTRTVRENTEAGENIGAPIAATDPNTGDTLTYTLGGTDAASFDIGESSGQLQTKAALDFEDKASYTVTVSVRDSKDADGNADTATDDNITVTITVTDVNEPPEFPSSETGARTVPENTPAGENIGGPVVATDPDSDTLTYTLEGTDAASFDIDSSTGQLKTKDALDFEAKPTLLLTVKADDSNGSTDTITVTITVTDENDAPAFSAETDTRTIPENTASGQNIGSPVAATDQDSGNTLTYTLGGDDADSFTVISTSGQLQTKAELDHETKPTYTVTVSVRDSEDSNGEPDTIEDDTITVTINVTDVNESPVVADTPNTNYAENDSEPVATYTATDPDEDATITWILEGDDKDDFDISQSGVLTFKTSPDYEVPADGNTDNVYMLTIKASDGEADHPLSVTVTVINVDEPGAVRLTSFYPQVGAGLTATLTDPDGDTTGVIWAWESSSNRDSDPWTPISGATSASYTPVDDDLDKYLRVTASYTDPEGSGKSAYSETTDPVRAAPATNAAPTFPSGQGVDYTRSVAENTPAGENIGDPVTATDTDAGDNLTYSLGSADGASFGIVQTSGQLQTKAALDYETKPSYTVVVTATDPSDEEATITVTINVTDVAVPPDPDAAPTVAAAETSGHFKLDVEWDAVNPGGASPVTGYQVQYQEQGATDEWSSANLSVTGVTATIVSLTPATPYEVQVRATSVEGPSGWSPSGTGSTNQLPLTVAYEKATYPVNEGGSVEVKVTLSPETNRNVDVPIAVKEETAETQDYQVKELTNDKLPFAPGDNFKTFTIKTMGDSDTSDETITLEFDELGLPDHVTLGTQKKAMVTIKDTTPNNPGNTGGSPSPPPPPPQRNDPPVFSGGRIARSVAENTAPGTDIGEPVEATDAADDSLTYSLSGDDGASFDINQTTGQLQTKDALDHETQGTYTVMVTATDPSSATATVDVTINVTDIDEKPGKPEAPELEPEATDGHSKLTVTWDPPANTGPDLTSYTSAHRKHGVQEWTTKTITVTTFADAANPTLNIIDLLPDTKYFARVQATSDEGTGEWSDEGSGTTATKPEADWLELTVDYAAATYSVTEGSTVTITVDLSAEADRKLAIPITVTPGTAETGDYTVSGLTGDALAFVPGESSKTFEISASRDNDGDDETVDLGFGSTLPTKVTAGTLAASQVTIDDNYRRNSGGGGGGGSPPVDTPPVDNPQWTPPVDTPPANNPPVFNPGTVETISVAENTVGATDIGDPVTAADSDANDTLIYSLDTASAKVFTIVADTGQLQTKGALNYEVKNSYTVTVTATDSSGAEATTDVTINVTDVEEPPGKPDAPTVGPASTDGHNTLSVSWNAPYNTGPAITSYTVEYRKHDSTEWTADNLTITGTTATITGLLPDTRYAATVRATNDEGTGKWSNEGYGSTKAIPVSEHLDLTVNYQAAAYTVTEGSSVTVTVTLSTAADRALAIPITITAGSAESGDYTAGGFDGGNALAFASGENSKAFTITANSDADTDDETLDLGFGTLPDKVTAGTTSVATVTINDQIVTLPQRTVSYGAASYTVNEGSSATIDVTLSQAADRALSVPITVTRGTAEARDYEVSGLTGGGVAFSQGANSGSFTITAAQDEDSSNETLSLGFGTMPGGVSAGSPATASVTIDDDDPPVVYNPPPRRRSGGSSRRRGSGGWVMGSENYPPVFMEGTTASREVPEIARKAANIGYPVTATDPNLDKLTYKPLPAMTGTPSILVRTPANC